MEHQAQWVAEGNYMIQSSLEFKFNTGITAPFEEGTGKFLEDDHKDQVLPMRAKLMELDGLTGCNISRYDLQVNYVASVVDRDAIIAHVNEVVAWAANQEGFFPNRGDKTPTAEARLPAPSEPERFAWVRVEFPTQVIRYPALRSEHGMDTVKFNEKVHPLAEKMTAAHGIVGYDIHLLDAAVRFDTVLTTRTAVADHLLRVLKETALFDENFFPYRDKVSDPEFVIVPEKE